MSNKLFPVGIQNFENLRNRGFVYVDKTALIYKLFTTGKYYFLGRPRRFGKSLLISTIEAYAQGKRHLFGGLALESLEKDWNVFPVLHLDLNTEKYDSAEALDNKLNLALLQWENLYGADPAEYSPASRFEGIIRRAHNKTGMEVVILVDEYDKPLLQAIGNETLQNEYRNTLKAFYGALKSMDGCIRFAMLTGVTKFGKVSVFSDLNNLEDISMLPAYTDLCGITEKEIHDNFEDELHELADHNNISYEEACKELRENYNGYHFTHDCVGVYNPFSLFNALKNLEFGNYWFETGTPTYLVKLLKKHKYDLEKVDGVKTTAAVLNSIDASSTDPIPVIYQSGYLTIKDYIPRFGIYELGFPNREVKQGFLEFLLPNYASVNEAQSVFEISMFVNEIENGDPDSFLSRLKTFFADTPYDLARDLELHYQNVLYIVFKLMGFYVQVEYHTNRGRIDLVLKTDDYIYLMEFKLDGSADQALRQIEDNGYAEAFSSDTRKMFIVGVNFSNELRNIEQWKIISR